jgi:hypothetical protein
MKRMSQIEVNFIQQGRQNNNKTKRASAHDEIDTTFSNNTSGLHVMSKQSKYVKSKGYNRENSCILRSYNRQSLDQP